MTQAAHILIADDVVELREVLRFQLEHEGFAVSEAGTGRDTIDQVERDRPEVLVLDVNMPDMDGWAVLDHLRRQATHRPRVAVLTTFADESVEILARNAGADAYLAKPLTADELTSAVRRLLSPEHVPGPRSVEDPDFGSALDRLLSSPTKAGSE
jgi:two-component system KDP operon response regulator KdpE